MKKASLLILIAAFCLMAAAAAGDTPVPDGYPAIRIDPTTGSPYNFGGATITIYDFWSGSDGTDVHAEDPTEEQAALYAYRSWLDQTYNCHIVQKQGGDWGSQVTEFNSFVQNPDGSYRLYIVEPSSIGSLVMNGNAASWTSEENNGVDLTDDKWNAASIDLYTFGGETYAVHEGKSEPRGLLYFNKRILTEAGINWNDLYDMQANETWTWNALVSVLQQVQSSGFNALVGSSEDFYKLAVFSNGGSFAGTDANGKLAITAQSTETIEALNWARDIWNTYAMTRPDDASWDWYKQAWKNGECAFYMYQAYGGFNNYSEMAGMEDAWGAVAFPLGPSGTTYVTVTSENATLMPNVYDTHTAAMLAMIYDLWTMPTPGYDDPDSWIGNKYSFTDARAVDETYAMLRENGHTVSDKMLLLGSQTSLQGQTIFWMLPGNDAETLIDQAILSWEALCDEFNEQMAQDGLVFTCENGVLSIHGRGALPDSRDWATFSGTATRIEITGKITSICAHAFDGFALVTEITLPDSVVTIGESAFDGCTALASVTFGGSRSKWEQIIIGEGNDALQDAQIHCSQLAAPVICDVVHGETIGTDFSCRILFPDGAETVYTEMGRMNGNQFVALDVWETDSQVTVLGFQFDKPGTYRLRTQAWTHGFESDPSEALGDSEFATYEFILTGSELPACPAVTLSATEFDYDDVEAVTYTIPGAEAVTFVWTAMDLTGAGSTNGIGIPNSYETGNTGTISVSMLNEAANHELTFWARLDGIWSKASEVYTITVNPLGYLHTDVMWNGQLVVDSTAVSSSITLPTPDAAVFTVFAENAAEIDCEIVRLDTGYDLVDVLSVFRQNEAVFDLSSLLEANGTYKLSFYVSTPGWVCPWTFLKLDFGPSNTCGDNATWSLDGDGTLRITGSGAVTEKPWADHSDAIRKVVIGEGITHIVYDAFMHCTALTEVSLPDSLISIGEFAFCDCTSLTEITIPDGLTTLEAGVFLYSGLTAVHVPAGADTKTWVFYEPDASFSHPRVYRVTLPASVETVVSPFLGTNLADYNPDFVTPADLTTIEAEAFYGTGASFIWLTDNVTSIGIGAFAGCENLRYIRIPYSCTHIDPGAFPDGVLLFVEYGSEGLSFAEDHNIPYETYAEGFNG